MVLTVPNEGLCHHGATFHTTKVVHLIVNTLEVVWVLAQVGITNGSFSRFGSGNVHIVRRPELRSLLTRHDLEIIKGKAFPAFKPGIEYQ